MRPESPSYAENHPLQHLLETGRFRDALALYFHSGEDLTGSTAESRLLAAQAAAHIGELEVSARLSRAARDAFEEAGQMEGFLEAEALLGSIALRRGRIREAEGHFRAMARAAEGGGNSRFIARSALSLGHLARLRGQGFEARSCYQSALDAALIADDQRGVAEAWNYLALTEMESGQLEAGREYSRRSREVAEMLGDPGLRAVTLLGRAQLLLAADDMDGACLEIQRAAQAAGDEGNEEQRLDAERLFALICLRRGNPSEAFDRAAMVLTRALENQLAVVAAECRILAALALRALGRHTEAVAARDASVVSLNALGAEGTLQRFLRDWERATH